MIASWCVLPVAAYRFYGCDFVQKAGVGRRLAVGEKADVCLADGRWQMSYREGHLFSSKYLDL